MLLLTDTITLIDIKTGQEKRFRDHHYGKEIDSAVFSPDGNGLLAVSRGHSLGKAERTRDSVGLWNLRGEFIKDLVVQAKIIYSAVFSPCGKYILVASENEVSLWDLENNRLAIFGQHQGRVYSAVFSPNGQRVLTASEKGRIKRWYTPEAVIHWQEKD